MEKKPKNIKIKAMGLRRQGFSLSEIACRIDVPKNTIQGWVKNIKLTRGQKLRLAKKAIACGNKGLQKALKRNRDKLAKWKENIRQRAVKYSNISNKRSDLAKLVCGILYLCEGAKYPSTRHLVFGSTDPRMIKLFLNLLRNNFHVDENKFRCRIMHRYDQNGDALEIYWSKLTGIPLRQFYKSYKDKRTKGKATKNKEYKGVCSVQYFSTDVQYELQSIGEALYF
ncbi:MAG: hypothetical protein KKD29_00495 [Candidatus Omnitrophica bacterium]|nr:hypothetical protein [Candidatus Omnitrophota bacterium]MBU4488120.1 hypothetical protein [Candidatus Omnitrophota bacterium]MCG2704954.1 hypothetical protein [Candidatus Omnitrophota bacterium]